MQVEWREVHGSSLNTLDIMVTGMRRNWLRRQEESAWGRRAREWTRSTEEQGAAGQGFCGGSCEMRLELTLGFSKQKSLVTSGRAILVVRWRASLTGAN